jgi:hypothetical protein
MVCCGAARSGGAVVRKCGIPAAVAAVFLAAPLAVSAQDFKFNLLQQEQPDEAFQFLPMKPSFLIGGRVSSIVGEVDPWVPVDYEDIFKTGWGAFIEGRMMSEVGPMNWMGGYLSLGWDEYEGKRDTDAYGDSLEPDKMDMITALIGAKGIYQFAPRLYVEGHMAGGLVYYDDVDGVFTPGWGGSSPVRVFDATWTGAFDMGARLGYTRKRFLAEIGFGMRFQGPPDDADFDFDSSGPLSVALEAAVGFQF